MARYRIIFIAVLVPNYFPILAAKINLTYLADPSATFRV